MAPSGLQPSPLAIVRPLEHLVDASVALEPVEGAAALVVVVGQAAGPQPSLRVTRRVVHPCPRRGDLGHVAQHAVRGQVCKPSPSCEEPSLVTLDRRDRADRARQAVVANRYERPVVADRVAMHAPGQDVHPQQLAPATIPSGALAEHVLFGRARGRVARHRMPSRGLRLHDEDAHSGAIRHAPSDMSSTTFTSSGCRVIASCHRSAGTLRLINPCSQAGSARPSILTARS